MVIFVSRKNISACYLKCFLLLLFFNLSVINLSSQNLNSIGYQPIYMPSPQAANFARYGNIPVNLSTGVPNINIPIYTCKSGQISLPVDLSYHSSGIKVTDVASMVGLGWNLNFGGVITRSILGTDDRLNFTPAYTTKEQIEGIVSTARQSSNPCNSVNYILQYFQDAKRAYDVESQSDRYQYMFPGHSGIFRRDFLTGQAKTVPYSALKISLGTNNAGPYQIVTEDGTKYTFAQEEKSYIRSVSPNPSIPPLYKSLAFYLTKIESADGTDYINIYYRTDQEASQIVKNYELVKGYFGRDWPTCASPTSNFNCSAFTEVRYVDNSFYNLSFPVLPDSIVSKNEVVIFNYTSDRVDIRKSRLNSLEVRSRIDRSIIRRVNFSQSNFGSQANGNQRLKLNGLTFFDNNLSSVENYSFDYNPLELPAYYSIASANHDPGYYNEDYWGYYNASNSKSLIPTEYIDYEMASEPGLLNYYKTMFGGNRNPNETAMQASILTKITYPTGGETEFSYEANRVNYGFDYLFTADEVPFAGLRVKSITSRANAGAKSTVKSYKYECANQTSFQSINGQLYKYTNDVTWIDNGTGTGGSFPIGFADGIYTFPTLHIGINPFYPLTAGDYAPVVYKCVKEFEGTETINNGYTVFTFEPPFHLDPAQMENPHVNSFYRKDRGVYQPLTKSTSVYNENGVLLKAEYNNYDYIHVNTFNTGLNYYRDYDFASTGSGIFREYNVFPCLYMYDTYFLENSVAYQDVAVLTSRTTTQQNLTSVESFSYDDVTLLPKQKMYISSKGNQISDNFKYPIDFPGDPVCQQMVQKNILDPVIEHIQRNEALNKELYRIKNIYSFWTAASFPWLTEVQKSINGSNWTVETVINSYDDNGNVQQTTDRNGLVTTYLWGYDSQYPVAKIVGSNFATVINIVNQASINSATSTAGNDAGVRALLQNIRNHFLTNPLVQVSTYTYKPLVGMTSETDPTGRTIYYEYDAFNRLKLQKDEQGNILKKYCYNYAGQPIDCN